VIEGFWRVRPRGRNSLVVGFDCGATKTECAISTIEGEILSYTRGPPSNYHLVGREGAKKVIIECYRRAKSGVKGEVEVVCVGTAGLDSRADEEIIRSYVEELPIRGRKIIVHDSEIALRAAFPSGKGVIVNAGTGSFVAGTDGSGGFARACDWGHIIGDEGGGYYLGRAALNAVMREYDGRGPKTSLTREIMSFWKLEEPRDIMAIVYVRKAGVTEIAALAPLVFKASEEGDAVAKSILESAARELALGVEAVVRRLGLNRGELRLALTGGLLRKGSPLRVLLVSLIEKEFPKLKLVDFDLNPVIGSLIFALEEAGVKIGERIIKKLRSSLQTLINVSEIRGKVY